MNILVKMTESQKNQMNISKSNFENESKLKIEKINEPTKKNPYIF